MSDGTAIEVLQLPSALILALKDLGHDTVESAFCAALADPGPFQKYVEAHLKADKKLFANFIAECALHLTATFLKYVSETEQQPEYGMGLHVDPNYGNDG